MRLDKYVAEKLNISREKAQEKIKNNLVSVNDKIINKPAYEVNESNEIKIIKQKDYVSRGSYKLLGAIKAFSLDFNDKVVLDLGASTGGFTQVALENNAKKVYAVDIGENQLADVLKNDKRIVNLSKTDVRNLNVNLVNDSQIVVGDLSFISLTKILPTIKTLFNDKKEMMLLFKPQFECGPIIAKKYKGIIKNKEIHIKILENFVVFVKLLGFVVSDIACSPITGGDGNIEYLIYINGKYNKNFNIQSIVENAFLQFKRIKND